MAPNVGKSLVVVMALGTFVVVLDNTIMNVSISALVADLQTTVSGVQAAIALNALMMAAFVLMASCSFLTGSNQLGSPHPSFSVGATPLEANQLGRSHPDFSPKTALFAFRRW